MINPLVASALLLAQAAPAERPCITPAEAGDMAVALMPSMIDAVTARCRPHLDARAFLLADAGGWTERLRRDAAPRRAAALRGIGLMTGSSAPPPGTTNEATFDFVAQMLAGVLTRELKPEYCADIDSIARSLAPLPPDNIAALVGATLSLAAAADAGDDDVDDDDDNDMDVDKDDEDPADADDEPDGPPICRADNVTGRHE